MKIRNKINGGVVEVSDTYGKALLATGRWEALETPKDGSPAQPLRKPRKAAQKAAQKATQAPKTK